MFIDARSGEFSELDCDVCIVGAGAAGITLARALAKKRFGVCLVESGGFEADPDIQRLYDGVSVGLPYATIATRLRYFGGTTGHWNGACWPLGDEAFQVRTWVPHSGWPLRKSELLSYYQKAHETLGLGPFNYDAAYWADKGSAPILSFRGGALRTSLYQGDLPPTRFGTAFRVEIAQSEQIRCLLHANVTHLHRDPVGGLVSAVTVRPLQGKACQIRAKCFVLATGGLENPRLLLLNEIGNEYDQVGRYFMEHFGVSGILWLLPSSANLRLYMFSWIGGTRIRAGFEVSPEVRERERLLSCWMGLRLESTWESRFADAWDQIIWPVAEGESPDNFTQHVKTMLASARRMLGLGPGGEGEPPELLEVPVTATLEQAPNPESRVMLDDSLDQLGQRRLKLDWRLTDLDHYSMARSLELLAMEVGRSNLGRIRLPFPGEGTTAGSVAATWRIEKPNFAYHHMGTTRMGDNPRTSVVDRHCRVFGAKNLYVAGSSVFPACSYNNPTLAILALAYRLAERIAMDLGQTA